MGFPPEVKPQPLMLLLKVKNLKNTITNITMKPNRIHHSSILMIPLTKVPNCWPETWPVTWPESSELKVVQPQPHPVPELPQPPRGCVSFHEVKWNWTELPKDSTLGFNLNKNQFTLS